MDEDVPNIPRFPDDESSVEHSDANRIEEKQTETAPASEVAPVLADSSRPSAWWWLLLLLALFIYIESSAIHWYVLKTHPMVNRQYYDTSMLLEYVRDAKSTTQL